MLILGLFVLIAGVLIGVCRFMVKRWRNDELERREVRRKKLAAVKALALKQAMAAPVAVDTSQPVAPVKTAFSLLSPERQKHWVMTEAEADVLADELKAQMEKVTAATTAVNQFITNWNTAADKHRNAAFAMSHCDAPTKFEIAEFTTLVTKRLQNIRDVVEHQQVLRAPLQPFHDLLKKQTRELATLAALLKDVTSYKASQLPPRLLILRTLGQQFQKRVEGGQEDLRKFPARVNSSIPAKPFAAPDGPETERCATMRTEIERCVRAALEVWTRFNAAAGHYTSQRQSVDGQKTALQEELCPHRPDRIAGQVKQLKAAHRTMLKDEAGLIALDEAYCQAYRDMDGPINDFVALSQRLDHHSGLPADLDAMRFVMHEWCSRMTSHTAEKASTKGVSAETKQRCHRVPLEQGEDLDALALLVSQTEGQIVQALELALSFDALVEQTRKSHSRWASLDGLSGPPRPLKPNDAVVGEYLSKLRELEVQRLTARRLLNEHCIKGKECIAKLKSEVATLGPIMVKLRVTVRSAVGAEIEAAVGTLSVMEKWLATHLDKQQRLEAKEFPAPETMLGTKTSTRQPEEADLLLIAELKKSARSLGFAVAQATIAGDKYTAATGRKETPPSVLEPNFNEAPKAQVDFSKMIDQMERFQQERVALQKEKADIQAERTTTGEASTQRKAKVAEIRQGLGHKLVEQKDRFAVVGGESCPEELLAWHQTAQRLCKLYASW